MEDATAQTFITTGCARHEIGYFLTYEKYGTALLDDQHSFISYVLDTHVYFSQMFWPRLSGPKYTGTHRTRILAFQMLSFGMPLNILFLPGFIVTSCTTELAIKGPCILHVLDEFHIGSRDSGRKRERNCRKLRRRRRRRAEGCKIHSRIHFRLENDSVKSLWNWNFWSWHGSFSNAVSNWVEFEWPSHRIYTDIQGSNVWLQHGEQHLASCGLNIHKPCTK